jgi:glutathione S-transferase
MSQYILYGRPGSGSVAVQVGLEEDGVPYERIWVGTSAAEVERFRAINPTGKVPALVLPDGTPMFESAAMLVHLALAHPAADLAPPAGTAANAHFLQWMVYLSANLYDSALRVYYSDRFSSRGEADSDAIREQGTRDFLAQLAFVSRFLSPFVLGSRYSAADPYLHMLASWFPGERQSLHAQLPALAEHARMLSLRPAIASVEADHAREAAS